MKRIRRKLLLLTTLIFVNTAGAKDNWGTFPGAHKKGHCVEYAAAVTYYLGTHGTESHFIIFEHRTGAHAVCMFKHGEQWYGVDNEWCIARRAKGMTELARVKSAFPYAVSIREH